MENQLIINDKRLIKIVKDNKLVMSKYYLEQSEQKLLYKIIEHIQANDFKTREITITYTEFYKEFKNVLGKNITKKDFVNLLENLQDKIPKILVDGKYIRIPWYHLIEDENYEYIQLEIPQRIFNYIYNLTKNFTMLNLKSLYSFKRFHSMRLYELMKQWSRENKSIEKTFNLDSLKALLGLEDKKGYNNFSNFKSKVLDKAIEEINSKSELLIEEITEKHLVKKNKKVIGVKFVIFDKTPKAKKSVQEKEQNKNYKSKELKFNNFDEREYDYDLLEKRLLGWDED